MLGLNSFFIFFNKAQDKHQYGPGQWGADRSWEFAFFDKWAAEGLSPVRGDLAGLF
jgi:hypothetical protein